LDLACHELIKRYLLPKCKKMQCVITFLKNKKKALIKQKYNGLLSSPKRFQLKLALMVNVVYLL
ncbi:MAG TPA: hypothetical protein VIC51_01595, partial [Psychromonas sp.]